MRVDATLAELSRIDALVERACPDRRSLGPARDRARPARQVVEALTTDVEPPVAAALAACVGAAVEAMVDEFPANVFWDVDYLAAALLAEARRGGSTVSAVHCLEDSGETLVALQRLFGRHGAIRFSYVHDFIYGFDWAKWVARAPEQRAAVGPFDRAFLRALLGRGHELLALIEADDAKYPRLPAGKVRNPFAFQRDPEAERQLHESLAASGDIPVETWRLDAAPRHGESFASRREARARALGIEATPPA